MPDGSDRGIDREVEGRGDDTLETEALDRVIAALRYADPDEVDVWAAPPADLEERIIERVRAERSGAVVDLGERRTGRRSRVPRILAAAAAAVAVVVLAVGAFSLIGDDSPSPPPSAQGETVELAGAVEGVTGSVVLSEGDDRTELHLVASGLEPNAVYAAWLAPPEGQGDRVPAGTVRADENGEVEADLVSSFPLESAARVWVTDPADETVLRAPLT
jgi:Anti-sigma-K factor rskA